MVTDAANPPLPSAPQGTILVGELDPLPAEPETKDVVYALETPQPIKAGDIVGHLGQYQRHQDLHPLAGTAPERPILHLEVFSTDDVPAFLEASRAHAANLDDQHKTLLAIEPGARLSIPGEPDVSLGADEGVILDTSTSSEGPWLRVRRATVSIVARSSLSGAYTSATRTYAATGAILLRILSADNRSEIDEVAFNRLDAAGKAKRLRPLRLRAHLPALGSHKSSRR